MYFEVFDLGLTDFKRAWDFQKERLQALKCGASSQALVLCQHHPVITLGRLADKKNILISSRQLSLQGIEVYQIERGGEVTYHGPGQLTVYAIFSLTYFKKDIHLFLRYLEQQVIDLLSDFRIRTYRIPGLTGVWVDGKKIASIGIAVKNWISFHGLSINIKDGDLKNFRFIRPCARDIQMVAMETVLGRAIEIDDIKSVLIHKFRDSLPNELSGVSCLDEAIAYGSGAA